MPETPSNPPMWNGVPLDKGVNRSALQWAWQQGPRLVELGMRGSERDVLMAIAAHTKLDGGNEAWPSQDAIVQMSTSGKTAVVEALYWLEKAGVIKRQKRRPLNTIYRITPQTGSHKWDPVNRKAAECSLSECSKSDSSESEHSDPEHYSSESGLSNVRNPAFHRPDSEHEQEKRTREVKQEKETGEPSSRSAADRSSPVGLSKQGINPDDLDDVPVQSAKRKLILNPTGKFSGQPQTSNPDPAQEFASWFYSLIGSPAREAKAARTVWARTLHPLLDHYGMETIKAIITWASENEFWTDKLCRKRGDSAEHALDKFDTWSSQRADESERQILKKPRQSSGVYKPVNSRPAAQTKLTIGIDPTR